MNALNTPHTHGLAGLGVAFAKAILLGAVLPVAVVGLLAIAL